MRRGKILLYQSEKNIDFPCDGKNVDVHINDRDGKNAHWAERLIDALKKENGIASIHLISDTELMDMEEKELIIIDEKRTLQSNP